MHETSDRAPRSRTPASLLLAAVLGLAFAAPVAANETETSVEGMLLSPAGTEVAAAEVEVWAVEEPDPYLIGRSIGGVMTDDRGRFVLKVPDDVDLRADGAHLRLDVRPPLDRSDVLPAFSYRYDPATVDGPLDLQFPVPAPVVEVLASGDQPVAGAWVTATTDEGDSPDQRQLLTRSGSTDAHGRVALHLPAPTSGSRTFVVRADPADGLGPATATVDVDSAGTLTRGGLPIGEVLILRPEEPDLEVVLEDVDGRPLAGQDVSLERWVLLDGGVERFLPALDASRRTDEQGRAAFLLDVEEGERARFRLRSAPEAGSGLIEARAEFRVEADGTRLDSRGEVLVEPVSLALSWPDLSVAVVDAAGGPVPGVRVRLEAWTDSDPDDLAPWQEVTSEAYLPYVGGALAVTDVDGLLELKVRAGHEPATRRLLLDVEDGPPIAHDLDVDTDGSLNHRPSDSTAVLSEHRVRFQLPARHLAADEPTPAWLVALNQHRGWAGLDPVSERIDWSEAARAHARYSVGNRWFGHGQAPDLPLASLAGEWAAIRGNLVRSAIELTPEAAMRVWINSPGHASLVLAQHATGAGFGSDTDLGQGDHAYSAVLPMMVERGSSLQPVRYPAHGTLLPVPDLPVELCAHEQGIPDRVCTLHLVDERVGEALTAGAGPNVFDAQVHVDGSTSTAQVDVWGVRHHLGLQLPRSLPADAHVEVDVHLDGQLFASWSFDTVGVAPGPTYIGSSTGEVPAVDPAREATNEDDAALQVPSDIDGTTHETAIRTLLDAGIVEGFGDGTFRPGLPVTRAQMASFLTRAFELDPAASGSEEFDGGFLDVDPEATHAAAIAELSKVEVTLGCGERRYCPADPVDRAQMASFLVRALDLAAAPASAGFADVPAEATHAASIASLADAGITTGCESDRFCPGKPVTRGQMATFVSRAIEVASP